MTLEDLYTQLSFGELRQLFLSGSQIDDPMAGMPRDSFIKLLPSVTLGLTELHKRFFLREGRVTLTLQTDRNTYVLSSRFAQSNGRSRELVKYLADTTSPFKDNLFKVERVYGTYWDDTYEIPLNLISNRSAIRTTSYNTLRVPTNVAHAPWLSETTALDIVFRADHPALDLDLARASPLSVLIDLPPTHLEALCFYIASRVYNPIGMNPGAMHEGNNFFTRFMASVEELKLQNYEIDDDDGNHKAGSRGFI